MEYFLAGAVPSCPTHVPRPYVAPVDVVASSVPVDVKSVLQALQVDRDINTCRVDVIERNSTNVALMREKKKRADV